MASVTSPRGNPPKRSDGPAHGRAATSARHICRGTGAGTIVCCAAKHSGGNRRGPYAGSELVGSVAMRAARRVGFDRDAHKGIDGPMYNLVSQRGDQSPLSNSGHFYIRQKILTFLGTLARRFRIST